MWKRRTGREIESSQNIWIKSYGEKPFANIVMDIRDGVIERGKIEDRFLLFKDAYEMISGYIETNKLRISWGTLTLYFDTDRDISRSKYIHTIKVYKGRPRSTESLRTLEMVAEVCTNIAQRHQISREFIRDPKTGWRLTATYDPTPRFPDHYGVNRKHRRGSDGTVPDQQKQEQQREPESVALSPEARFNAVLSDLKELNEAITQSQEPHVERLREVLEGLDLRTFGSQERNAEVTEALAAIMRRLEMGVECPKDDTPSVLRNYPAQRGPDGNYRFIHSEDKDGEQKQAQHGGFETFAELKLVPRPYGWGPRED